MRLNQRIQPHHGRGEPGNLLLSADSPSIFPNCESGEPEDASYKFETYTLADAVDKCVSGIWDMPDFQRGFVWKPDQSAMLADSLWRNYPTGFILLWSAPLGTPDHDSRAWIADGQQRLTSLCLLFGKKPRWWGRRPEPEWGRVRQRYDIRFDIEGEGYSRFLVEHGGMDENRFVPVPQILATNPNARDGRANLQEIAARAKSAGHAEHLSEEEVLARLIRVAELREKTFLVNSVSHEFKDVLEIFDRLNSRGIRFRWLVIRTVRETLSAALGGAGMDRAMRGFRTQKPI
jgi:Protein of unknown function DUF262